MGEHKVTFIPQMLSMTWSSEKKKIYCYAEVSGGRTYRVLLQISSGLTVGAEKPRSRVGSETL